MKVFVTIDGIDNMIDEMKKMSDKGKAILDDVAKVGAQFSLSPVRNAIPLGDESGVNEANEHLKNTIKVKKVRRTSKVKSSALLEVGKDGTEYGFHLETGHVTKSGKYVSPRPFIRATIDNMSEEIGRVMGEEFIKRVGV